MSEPLEERDERERIRPIDFIYLLYRFINLP
jgi:hypothetical protein